MNDCIDTYKQTQKNFVMPSACKTALKPTVSPTMSPTLNPTIHSSKNSSDCTVPDSMYFVYALLISLFILALVGWIFARCWKKKPGNRSETVDSFEKEERERLQSDEYQYLANDDKSELSQNN